MPPETAAAHPTSFLGTQRRDLWWIEPAVYVAILGGFVAYATFRVFEGNDLATRFFEVDNGHYHYLSPFGTPDLTFLVPAFLRDAVAQLPFVGTLGVALLTNPAFLVLPLPAGFRFTCYYYRKAYYRSFVARPAACGVEATKGKKYRGEKGLMVIQNVHRYFLYLAILVTAFLAYDAVRGIWTPHGLYFGLGNAIMVLNVGLLMGYTFGCHSFRHLVGGKLDCYSCDAISQTRYTWWQYVTKLNQNHMWWAMASLFSVALTDVYIRWVGQSGMTHILGVPV
ncbi:MAG: hypothetical protein QOJ26_1664 [Thermoplasmata archaeon]|jgi:hypothetical protein|nr:hypothetical protein [Thermoplasmata archaeon]